MDDAFAVTLVITFGSLIIWVFITQMRLNLLSKKVYGLAKNIDKMIEVQGNSIKTNKKIIEHIKYLEQKKDE